LCNIALKSAAITYKVFDLTVENQITVDTKTILLKEKGTSLDHGPKDHYPNEVFLGPLDHGQNYHEKSDLDHLPKTINCT
jgi:hypothetical protein